MPATLTTLRIRNLALVEQLDWTLSAGFTAITGETGAGKSVILGALNLLMGERADRTLLRAGAEQCSVEAVFHLDNPQPIDVRLVEQGVEPCDQGDLLIKRIFTASGTNRQFVNCSATTVAVLKELGEILVDLHGPHDHQSLFSMDRQREVLDLYADSQTLLSAYRSDYKKLQNLQRELDEITNSENLLEQEIELLRHQASEIEQAQLIPGEEEPLLARFTKASNSRRLLEVVGQINQLLSEDEHSVLNRLSEAGRLFRDLERLDPSASDKQESHTRAVIELEELSRTLSDYAESLEQDPEQLALLEERVNLLESLKRKYGATIEEINAFGERVALRLRTVEGRGETIADLKKEITEVKKSVKKEGEALGALRAKAAPKLAESVRRHLLDLGFKQAGFGIELKPTEQPQLNGLEEVEFVFAPNPGEPMRPLRAIASSGEISRVMLALKTALAAQDNVALLVFDEIDANVGGEIANAVGRKMAVLAMHHQVLCITHLPQVASQAKSHFVVRKETRDGRTHSLLDAVKGDARIREIARMLGGASDSSLALAKALLKQMPSGKNRMIGQVIDCKKF